MQVINKKRELCVKCRFELEWELIITLERHVMDGMVDANLRVIDLAFSDDLGTSVRQEIRATLKKYDSVHHAQVAEIHQLTATLRACERAQR